MSERRITRRSGGERKRGRTRWKEIDRLSEKQVAEAAASDEDNPLWTVEELKSAELVLPSGQPKVPVSIRLDQEVLDFFRAQGSGYQSRINAVLRAYVRSRRSR